MVENRPGLTFLSHAVLILGVLLIAFPLYVTFVASTHRLEDIMQVPMPLLPGDQLVQNYAQVLGAGTTTGSKAAVGNMLINSTVRSEEHTSELQSQSNLVCRLLLEKKK